MKGALCGVGVSGETPEEKTFALLFEVDEEKRKRKDTQCGNSTCQGPEVGEWASLEIDKGWGVAKGARQG